MGIGFDQNGPLKIFAENLAELFAIDGEGGAVARLWRMSHVCLLAVDRSEALLSNNELGRFICPEL
jgi:hypothetical protein